MPGDVVGLAEGGLLALVVTVGLLKVEGLLLLLHHFLHLNCLRIVVQRGVFVLSV